MCDRQNTIRPSKLASRVVAKLCLNHPENRPETSSGASPKSGHNSRIGIALVLIANGFAFGFSRIPKLDVEPKGAMTVRACWTRVLTAKSLTDCPRDAAASSMTSFRSDGSRKLSRASLAPVAMTDPLLRADSYNELPTE